MISAIEQMRCRHDHKLAATTDERAEDESDEEIAHLKRRIRAKQRQKLEKKQCATYFASDGSKCC